MADSVTTGWRAPGTEFCAVHPELTAAALCGDCRHGMCRECFDAAPWPWKVCPDCHALRIAAVGGAAGGASASTSGPGRADAGVA
jgi:hypothetical protein